MQKNKSFVVFQQKNQSFFQKIQEKGKNSEFFQKNQSFVNCGYPVHIVGFSDRNKLMY